MKCKLAGITLSVLPTLLLILASAALAAAQETPAQPRVLTNPDVNYPLRSDVSRPLRDMATEVSPQKGFHEASPIREPKLQLLIQAAKRGEEPAKDGALQSYAGPLSNASIGLSLLGVGNGFPGYSPGVAPSDVNLAVGDTQVLQWVNLSYAVFDKATGAVIAGPIQGNAFWLGFGGQCETSNNGDIIAQWDKLAHRWLVSQNGLLSPYMTCVAVSTTPDATGTYYRYAFPQPNFPDYPKWGIWPDAYYQSQDLASGGVFVGAYACAYERAKMLAGDSTAEQICFQTGTFDDSLLPGDLDSAATPPPAGQPEVFLGSIDNSPPNGSRIFEYLFHVDFTTPSNSTFTGAGGTKPITVANFALALCSHGSSITCVPQSGTSDKLHTLGTRLMYRLAYRNFSDHQTWLVSHSVNAGNSVGVRWYELRSPETSTNLSVYQQGTFAPDSNYRWMGSIAMDGSQDIALGYNVSSASMFPSISYTGRVSTDPLGTMETEGQIVAGSGSQIGTNNRWGDYTGMAIDAADDCTFWYTAQYYLVTASYDWSTRLASFKFPGCGGSPPADFSISALPLSQTISRGSAANYTVTVTPVNGFVGTVNLSISGCPPHSSCTFNPASLAPPYQASTLTVSTAGNTGTGTYALTITGTSSTLVHSTTVSLTVTR